MDSDHLQGSPHMSVPRFRRSFLLLLRLVCCLHLEDLEEERQGERERDRSVWLDLFSRDVRCRHLSAAQTG